MSDVVVSQIVTAAVTLLTAYFGARWSARNDERKDHRAAQHERELRDAEAERRLTEDRHRQQLEALMALQEDVQTLGRTTAKGLHIDLMRARAGETDPFRPADLQEQDQQVRQRLNISMTRVLDEGVRDSVDEVMTITARVTLFPIALSGLTGGAMESEAGSRTVKATNATVSTLEVLGEAVRRELAWKPSTGLSR